MIKVDFSEIRHGRLFSWEESIGMKIKYTLKNGDIYYFTVLDYHKDIQSLTILHNDEISTVKINSFRSPYKILGQPRQCYVYKVGEHISDNGRNLIVKRNFLGRGNNGGSLKYVECKCMDCGWENMVARERDLFAKKSKCGCCRGNITVEGINDINTTNKDILQFIKNKEEAKLYSKGSHVVLSVVCPICGFEKTKSVKDLCTEKSIGCVCSRVGKSTGERFMSEILRSANITFVSEYNPEWISPKRYDFYLPDYNIILEIDGGFHKKVHSRSHLTLQEVVEVDEYKTKMAIEHDLFIFRIDTSNRRKTESTIIDFCTNTLSKYCSLNDVDFYECAKISIGNYIDQVIKFIKDGHTKSEAAEYFGLSFDTIGRYLTIAKKITDSA